MDSTELIGKVTPYINSLKGKRADSTLLNSAIMLRDFVLWVKSQPQQGIKEVVEGYLSYLKNTRKLKHSTINMQFFVIKPYIDWITRDHSTLKDVELYVVMEGYIDYRPLEELCKLLPKTETLADKCMLIILIFTGARIGEVLQLRQKHIDIAPNGITIKFRTEKRKKNPIRAIPVKDQIAIETIKAHVESLPSPETKLFTRTYKSAWYQIKLLCKRAHIKSLNPHTFRHSLATALLKKGVNIRTIQRWLGHSSVTTTEKYTHISGEDLLDSAPIVGVKGDEDVGKLTGTDERTS